MKHTSIHRPYLTDKKLSNRNFDRFTDNFPSDQTCTVAVLQRGQRIITRPNLIAWARAYREMSFGVYGNLFMFTDGAWRTARRMIASQDIKWTSRQPYDALQELSFCTDRIPIGDLARWLIQSFVLLVYKEYLRWCAVRMRLQHLALHRWDNASLSNL